MHSIILGVRPGLLLFPYKVNVLPESLGPVDIIFIWLPSKAENIKCLID